MPTYAIIDTETTGLVRAKACEIAWLIIDEDLRVLDAQVFLTDPQQPIEEGAFNVHGISQEKVTGLPDNAAICSMIPKPVVWIGHNCLTGDHEILTKSGWQRLDSVEATVEAAVWNSENSQVTFEVCQTVVKPAPATMLEYDTLFHKGVYTDEHRIYHTKTSKLLGGGKPKWEVLPAKAYAALGANSVAIPSAGWYQPEFPLDLSPMEARLLEMARADSSIEGSNSLRWRFSKPRKVSRCLELLDALGLPHSVKKEDRGTTRISLKACALRDKVIALLGSGLDKSLGSWVLNLSLEAREALLDEAAFWDGDWESREGANKQTTVCTSKRSEAEWLQIAGALSGRTSKVTLDKPNTRGFSRADGTLSRVGLRTRSYIKTLVKPATVCTTAGSSVYCLTTSTGAFLVRRKGCVWVTGNCVYDQGVIGEHVEFEDDLCTLALSRRWVKGTPNHKLTTLKECLKLSAQDSHSALGDCYSTLDLLRFILPICGRTLAQLVDLERAPKMLNTMPFGMHRGKAFSDIPKAYREWLLERTIPKDLRYTLEKMRIL